MPPSDLPFYGARFLADQLRAWVQHRGVSGWWGPRPRDFRELMRSHPVDELCALQWARCVDASIRGLAGLPDDQLLHVSYEDFVSDPDRPGRGSPTSSSSRTATRPRPWPESRARASARVGPVSVPSGRPGSRSSVAPASGDSAMGRSRGLSPRQAATKRAIDVLVAGIALVVLSPVLAVAWVVATIDTRANGIFRQTRIGRDGQEFTVYKMRTMRDVSGHRSTVTVRGDRRITRSGAVLRSSEDR